MVCTSFRPKQTSKFGGLSTEAVFIWVGTEQELGFARRNRKKNVEGNGSESVVEEVLPNLNYCEIKLITNQHLSLAPKLALNGYLLSSDTGKVQSNTVLIDMVHINQEDTETKVQCRQAER